jgi:hypothetical protein
MRSLIENFSDDLDQFSDSVINDDFRENFILSNYPDKILKLEGRR